MNNPKAYIGTSGWNYQHWKGSFYPNDVHSSQWLHYLAERFNSVEINTSFYRIPAAQSVAEWQKQVPNGFRFAVKLWRGITHFKKLNDCGDYTKRFLEAFAPLDTSHRGPLLVQLPPQQGKDVDKLRRFLNDFKTIASPDRWKVTVEFRHDDWLSPDVRDVLDREHVALCLHDIHPGGTDTPNDVSFVYVRRHGREAYRGKYGPRQIETDARHIRSWLAEGRTVFEFFNNDVEGHAVVNARQLQQAIAN